MPFSNTRPLNFWLCLLLFDVYSRKALQRASSKTTPTIFFFAKIVASCSEESVPNGSLSEHFFHMLLKAESRGVIIL